MAISKHSKRVASLLGGFVRHLKYKDELISEMVIGAFFHDIGKYFIPNELWDLPRPLTEEEFSIVKRHPKIGHEVLNYITDNEIVLNMCLYHHERWNGDGYPYGLKGDEIPLESRIVALCDVYEALSTERHYKSEIAVNDTLGIMEIKLGNHFDPLLGRDFINYIKSEQVKEFNKINKKTPKS